MAKTHDPITTASRTAAIYSAAARHFHWVTAAAVIVMVPLGLAMTYRGDTMEIWDTTTNALYGTHKLLGFVLLWLVAGRLAYRLIHGAPPDEPTVSRLQRAVAHLVHWLLYGLLLVVPLLGWVGISLYPSLGIFGLFDLPAMAAPDETLAARVLDLHGTLALVLAGLAAVHIAAALYHHFVRKDGVLRRMLPRLKQG